MTVGKRRTAARGAALAALLLLVSLLLSTAHAVAHDDHEGESGNCSVCRIVDHCPAIDATVAAAPALPPVAGTIRIGAVDAPCGAPAAPAAARGPPSASPRA